MVRLTDCCKLKKSRIKWSPLFAVHFSRVCNTVLKFCVNFQQQTALWNIQRKTPWPTKDFNLLGILRKEKLPLFCCFSTSAAGPYCYSNISKCIYCSLRWMCSYTSKSNLLNFLNAYYNTLEYSCVFYFFV